MGLPDHSAILDEWMEGSHPRATERAAFPWTPANGVAGVVCFLAESDEGVKMESVFF